MTARFAGSRTLDERRRRRLATNESDRIPAASAENPPQNSPAETNPRKARLGQFPIRKVISPKAWKIALAGVLAGLMGLMILAAGATSTPDPAMMGPGWQRLMDANGGSLARLYRAGLLMMSGQLAFLIWWGRSRSLRDFEGQYRIWLWAAATMMFAGWGLLGNWHWAFSETVCRLWSARFPQREVVCWLFPSALVAGLIWRKLHADMRECKSSFLLLWLAAMACLAAGIFRLGIDRTGWPSSTKQLAGAGLQMLACVSLFASLLAHARYVIHISAEPPQPRHTVWARLFSGIRFAFQKLPKPRLSALIKKRKAKPKTQSAKSAKQKAQAATPDASATDQTSVKATTKTTAKKPAPRKPAKPPEPKPEIKPVLTEKPQATDPPANPVPGNAKPKFPAAEAKPTPPATENKAVPPAPKTPEPAQKEASSEPQLRLDDPLDPNELKGLSKKERRRLRKQHKDSQRKT